MLTYRVSKVHINEKHNLFLWCDLITSLGKNLYNASLFRQRQLLTSLRKNDDELTDNEKEVIHEFVNVNIKFTKSVSLIFTSSGCYDHHPQSWISYPLFDMTFL